MWCEVKRATGKEEERVVAISLEQGLPRPRIFKVFSRSSSSCEVIKNRLVEYATVDVQVTIEILLRPLL